MGVNLLTLLTRKVAEALDTSFDIEIVEAHHNQKVDAPSGTALMLGEAAAAGRGVSLDDVADRGRDGIRVNCIAPGLVKTEFARALWDDERTLRASTADAALGRIAEPDEMAGAVVYFASPASSFVTGQTLVLDGGRLL